MVNTVYRRYSVNIRSLAAKPPRGLVSSLVCSSFSPSQKQLLCIFTSSLLSSPFSSSPSSSSPLFTIIVCPCACACVCTCTCTPLPHAIISLSSPLSPRPHPHPSASPPQTWPMMSPGLELPASTVPTATTTLTASTTTAIL